MEGIYLTTLEILWGLATGSGPVVEKAREMIGEGNLALLLAKAALSGTSEGLSSTRVGEALGITQAQLTERLRT